MEFGHEMVTQESKRYALSREIAVFRTLLTQYMSLAYEMSYTSLLHLLELPTSTSRRGHAAAVRGAVRGSRGRTAKEPPPAARVQSERACEGRGDIFLASSTVPSTYQAVRMRSRAEEIDRECRVAGPIAGHLVSQRRARLPCVCKPTEPVGGGGRECERRQRRSKSRAWSG